MASIGGGNENLIYLWDQADVDGAIGYHDRNNRGIPFGFVFTSISQQIGEPWSVTLSHEALELIADPETNLLVMGPHPNENRIVFHWFEMCDAVQAETYEIDSIAVSNFVLPLYFTGTRSVDEVGARNDFLGRVSDAKTLKPFGINRGGYVGFFDPESGDHDTYSIRDDDQAKIRLLAKSKALEARRSVRYRTSGKGNRLQPLALMRSQRRTARPIEVPIKAVTIARQKVLAPPRTAAVKKAVSGDGASLRRRKTGTARERTGSRQ